MIRVVLEKPLFSGATSKTYTLTSADVGKFISFEVTPVNANGSGTAVESSINSTAVGAPIAYKVSIAKTTDGAENNGGNPTDAAFTVTVTPQNESDGAITGDIAYSGTASNGTDYATGVTTFSIADGQSTATITLDVTEDALVEQAETIIATLSNPALPSLAKRGAVLARSVNDSISVDTAAASATANLTDDDTNPTAANVTFTGALEEDGTVTGNYTYADGDGDLENGSTFKWYRSDDTSGTGKAAISGATSKTYTLTSADVGKFISFEVTPVNANGSGTAVESSIRSTAVGAPIAYKVSIAKTTDGAENNGGNPTDAAFTVTVTPQNESDGAITGDITYSGTASNGTDYATGVTTFSIADGQSSTTITLDVTEDTLVEGTETIIATLSNPALPSLAQRGSVQARSVNDSVSLDTTSATANITDDDTDNDGVDAATEDAAPNGGDGNNDGIPDSTQPKVTSVKEESGSAYFTIDVSGTSCTQISNVGATTEATLGVEDPEFDFEIGLVQFTLTGCSTANVELFLHGLDKKPKPEEIRKFGLLNDRTTRGWYSLPGNH